MAIVPARHGRRTSRLTRGSGEIAAAIELVSCRVAHTVRLAGLPDAERLAAPAAARADAAGVAFRVLRDDTGRSTLVIGPLLAPTADRS